MAYVVGMSNIETATKFIEETIKPSLKEAALARVGAWIAEASETGYYRCQASMSHDGREYVQDAPEFQPSACFEVEL